MKLMISRSGIRFSASPADLKALGGPPFRRGRWAKVLLVTGIFAAGNTTGFLAGKKWSDYEHSRPPAVMSVYDGDTFTLINKESVRLYGIDAPEINYLGQPPQPFAEEAQRFMAERLQGQRFDCGDKGQSLGRDVCVVRLEGRDLGLELVRQGLAYADIKHTSAKGRKIYEQAEAEARAAKRGVWSLPGGGERPWDYRARILKERREQAAKKAEQDKKASRR